MLKWCSVRTLSKRLFFSKMERKNIDNIRNIVFSFFQQTIFFSDFLDWLRWIGVDLIQIVKLKWPGWSRWHTAAREALSYLLLDGQSLGDVAVDYLSCFNDSSKTSGVQLPIRAKWSICEMQNPVSKVMSRQKDISDKVVGSNMGTSKQFFSPGISV